MARRSNKGLFQRLLEAGSRTTYQGKIRTRGGKRQRTVRTGTQSVYKGVRIIPVGNGEFETSLDSSRFESKRDARRFVDAWRKRGNPQFAHERKAELIRELRKPGLSEAEIRRLEDELEDILHGRHALSGRRVKAPNPRRFSRGLTDLQKRTKLRRKQDQLIRLAEEKGIPDSFQISSRHPGSPSVRELRQYIHPQWEHAVDQAIRELKRNPKRNQSGDFYNYAVIQGTKRPGRNYIAHYSRDTASKTAYEGAESLRKTHTLWGNDGSGNMTKLETWTPGKADRRLWKERGWNPGRKKGQFARCVEAVSSRGGAYDPQAVCAAQERRKYGQKELTRRAKAGKKAKGRRNPEGNDLYRAIYDRLSDPEGVVQISTYAGSRLYRAKHRGIFSSGKPGEPGVYVKRGKSKDYVYPQYVRLGYERTKSNPADAAMAVSEEFHGRKVKAMIPVQQKRHYHKYLAELGELRKLEVLARDGKHKVTLSKFDGAMLCANEDKNQLFIVDGDQSVNLKDFGIKNPHETETLGEVTKIEYFTDKEHLGSEGGTAVYVHKFRTTNGNRGHQTVRMARNPDLIYHLRDEHLEFSGGSYEIKAEGIDK